MNDDYRDIIHLPHHVSKRHHPMPAMNRAAQFAPFAALAGFEKALHQVELGNREWGGENGQNSQFHANSDCADASVSGLPMSNHR